MKTAILFYLVATAFASSTRAAGNTTNAEPSISPPVWIIDEFVSDEGRIRYDGSLSYVNTTTSEAHGSGSAFLKISPTQVIPVISSVDNRTTQANKFVGMLGVRYGLTSNSEVGLRTTGFWSQTRQFGQASGETKDTQAFVFSSLSANATSRILQASDSSIFAYTSIGLLDRIELADFKPKNVNLRTFTLGLGGYVVDDPIVFSASTSATLVRPINFGGHEYKQGNFLTFSPGVSFIANDRVTLSSGVELSHQFADRYAGRKLNASHTRMSALLGAGYAVDDQLSLYVNYLAELTGMTRNSTAQISFIYKN